jgi:Mrp family chromosome partitioning ATPase
MKTGKAGLAPGVAHLNRSTKLPIYGTFLQRWVWFILLSVVLTTVCSYFIADPPLDDRYEAVLHVQVYAVGDGRSVEAKATTAFYVSLLQSPGVLDLALTRLHTYPQFKPYRLVDLQSGLVTVHVIHKTNVILLAAYGDTAQDASLIATAVYTALIEKIRQDRSAILNGIMARLSAEQVEVQTDIVQTQAILNELKASGGTFSSQYALFANKNTAQKQRLQEIGSLQARLKKQSYDPLIGVAGSVPDVTTLPGSKSTMSERLLLAPCVGLIMGLGGALLASSLLTKASIQGRKRGLSLAASAIPQLDALKDLAVFPLMHQASRLLPLLRRLFYQASERKRPLQVITVTSAHSGEGKSIIAACLAIAAAQCGLKTLLVDANARRPVVHTLFEVPAINGTLKTIRMLVGGGSPALPIQATAVPNLGVMPIGSFHEGEEWEEPLRADGLQPLVSLLRKQADIIVFDGPALLQDTNISALAALSDTLVLAVDMQKGQYTAVLEAQTYFAEMNLPFTMVLNRVQSSFDG